MYAYHPDGYDLIYQAMALSDQQPDPGSLRALRHALDAAEQHYTAIRNRKRLFAHPGSGLTALPAELREFMRQHASRTDLITAMTEDLLARGKSVRLKESDQELIGFQQEVGRLVTRAREIYNDAQALKQATGSRALSARPGVEHTVAPQSGQRDAEMRDAALPLPKLRLTGAGPIAGAELGQQDTPRADEPEGGVRAELAARSQELAAVRLESAERHERARRDTELLDGLRADIIHLLDTLEPQWQAAQVLPRAPHEADNAAEAGDASASMASFYAISLETTRNHLLKMLEQRFGLRSIAIAAASPFDQVTMAIVGTNPTDDSQQNHRVSRVVRRGYLTTDSGAIYRPAEVYVFKLPS
jgi:hypothetical protein